MRSKSLIPSIILVLAVVSSISAQGYLFVLPDEVIKPFVNRREIIERSMKEPPVNEWSGNYVRDVNSLQVEAFVWSSQSGFASYSDTCSNGPRAWVNYGTVSYRDDGLKLSPEREKTAQFALNFSEYDFTPVRWGEQHWLVPTSKLALFAYTINSRSGDEGSIGFLKWDDRDKPQSPRPDLPQQYARFLSMPTVKASIVDVGKNIDDWSYPLTINVGRDKGLIEGMSFWLVGHKRISAEVVVGEIQGRTSVVWLSQIGYPAGKSKILPKVGWRFTSKAPWASSRR